eukprot:15349504-Ditylum_brightwellii.AAC.1
MDFRRHGSLSADAMSVKDMLVYDIYSQKVIGFADESWNHVDAIAAALSSLAQSGDNSKNEM